LADRGEPDPQLVAALAARDPEAIRAALTEARLLVAVVALPGAEHASEGEMALALLEAADGAQALPAFTGLQALSAWRPDARPVPRPATEVIAYATAERLPVVLDPGSPYAWTLTAAVPEVPVQPAYTPPTWKPGRRLRKAARHENHRTYAVDLPSGPALAVICPDGTLDPVWAGRLVEHSAGAQLMVLPADAEADVRVVGVPLS
jgi:hypothetical protein